MAQRYETYKDSGMQWLGEIPGHWGCVPFRRIASVKSNLVHPNDYLEFPQVSPDCIEKDSGRLISWKTVAESNVESDNHRFYKGQIIYSKIRPLLNKVIIAPFDGLCSADMYPIETTTDTKYLQYYMLSNPFLSEVRNVTRDRVKMPKINREELGQVNIVVPSRIEQQSIVSYLDDKCGKIDEWIAQKQKEVELLGEMKQRVIADAVTRGLDPNVKMKRTNIPWLPEVPEHWDYLRNKSLLKLTDEKVGNRKDITLLSLTKQGVIIRDISEGKGKFPKDFDSYLVVRPNNLVFCLFDVDETPRTVGLVKNYGMLTGAYTNFEVNDSLVLPEYIYNYYLQVDNIKGLRPYYTGLRKVVKTSTFLQIRMPVPPLSEQQAIVAHITAKTAKINKLMEHVTREIENLKEYKQRLISDVVTGQIKVC